MNKWIKCSEEMPEHEKYVLTFDSFAVGQEFHVLGLFKSIYSDDIVWTDDDGEHEYQLSEILYWLPIPEKPKLEEE